MQSREPSPTSFPKISRHSDEGAAAGVVDDAGAATMSTSHTGSSAIALADVCQKYLLPLGWIDGGAITYPPRPRTSIFDADPRSRVGDRLVRVAKPQVTPARRLYGNGVWEPAVLGLDPAKRAFRFGSIQVYDDQI